MYLLGTTAKFQNHSAIERQVDESEEVYIQV